MYHNWSASEENMLLGVPKVIGWLVWMGLMSAFQLWCEILEKRILSLFVGIFAGVNECSFSKFVTNNYGIPKIHVFLHPEMLEFHVVGELSCWGRKLE